MIQNLFAIVVSSLDIIYCFWYGLFVNLWFYNRVFSQDNGPKLRNKDPAFGVVVFGSWCYCIWQLVLLYMAVGVAVYRIESRVL